MAESTINIRCHMNGTTDHCCFNNQELTDEQIAFITLNLPVMCTSLNLARTDMTYTGFGYVATNLLLRGNSKQLNIKSLILYDTALTDQGVALLCRALIDGRNSKLEHLNISLNPHVTAAGAQEIARMLAVNQGLRTLDLSYTSIGGSGVFDVCQALDRKDAIPLRCLDISFSLSPDEKESNEELQKLLKRINQRLTLLDY